MVIFYHLMAAIDWALYSIAGALFRLIIDIANTPLFRAERISEIASRIYIVVGVVMLFKLVISAIQYMINPDVFDDKEKGLAGLLKKTALSLVMIVIAPTVFNFLLAVQVPIVEALPKIILGSEAPTTTEGQQQMLDDEGAYISFNVLSSFITLKSDHTNDVSNAGVGEGKQIHDFKSFYDHVTEHCPWTVFGDMNRCTYNYMIVVSSVCGGFLVYSLLGMALDIAVRTIKLGVIQMLAPIPISSYVFSKDKLSKFIKTASTVYIDLFVRMAIVYFIIFAIKEVMRTDVLNFLGIGGGGVANTGNWFRNTLVNVCLIFGLLMFASKAPKFISELLGLPDIGSGEFADMFKPAWQRAGGAAVLPGMIGTGVSNMINRAKLTKNDPQGSFGQKLKRGLKIAGSGIAGATSAGLYGGIAAAQGKSLSEVNQAGHQRAIKARTSRDISRIKGATGLKAAWARTKIRAQDYAGLVTAVSLMESQQKAMSTVTSAEKAEIGRTNDILSRNAHAINANGSKAMSASLNDLASRYISQVNARTAVNAAGRTVITSGIADTRLKNMMESIVNGDEVALSEVLSFADYTGDNGELKQISQLLNKDGDYRSNLHKNATQDAYNGGVEQLASFGGGTFSKLDSKSSDFDTQLKGFHASLLQSFVDNADALSEFENSVKKMAEVDLNKGRITTAEYNDIITRKSSEKTVAEYLERVYREHTRMTEAAIDDATTTINNAINSAPAQRERVIREDIRRRSEKDKK